jgi:sialic acid synthase SpsE
MVLAIKDLESSLGDGIKKPTESEENTRMIVRRSLVAKVDIPKGKTITEDVLDIKRPGTGIKPKYWDEIIGKKARENIKKHDVLTWGTIE